MKITDVKVWLVQGIKYNWTLLKIYTDEGYTGVGEATNWPGSPIVFEAAKHVGQRIIGLDPMKTDFIWTKLYRDLNWIGPYGASLCAISGIDEGKSAGRSLLRVAGRRLSQKRLIICQLLVYRWRT